MKFRWIVWSHKKPILKNQRLKSQYLLSALYKISGLLLLLLNITVVQAASLESQLTAFFQQQHQNDKVTINVVVKTPVEYQPNCESPLITLPSASRAWGNLSISVTCNQQRSFVQAEVQATGTYLVAARTIESGTKITAQDIKWTQGRLDKLPPTIILQENKLTGAVAVRRITPNQPLTTALFRRAWVIKAGQNVLVEVKGAGFTITNSGKALNNAAIADQVRIRMQSGQVVTGNVNDNGRVTVDL